MQPLQKFETRILLDPLRHLFQLPEERPLRIMYIASYLLNVRRAVLNEPNPIPGLTSRLMNLWSCSTILLRYLTNGFSSFGQSLVFFKFVDCWGISGILIHIYDSRLLVMGCLQCFTQEALCSSCIPFGTEHEVQGVSF